MASVTKRKSGGWRIRFYGREGAQTGFYVGPMTRRDAELIASHVEHLSNARAAKVPLHKATAEWLGSQDSPMRAKLVRVGLIEAEAASTPTTLRAFLDSYADMRGDVKESTREQFRQAARTILEFFGDGCRIDSITAGDAEEFRAWMVGKRKARLAENTARRTCARAKQFFAHAVYKGMIPKNPFAVLKRLQVTGNRNRQQFVTRDVIEKVLKACPSDDWRLLVLLCRFGGLRVSEAANLRWEHVDLTRNRVRVHCSKTEHHAGREWREVPVFPELRGPLDAARRRAEDGAEWVLPAFLGDRNHGTQFRRIISRAGVKAWPKPFQNLRSSRETELTTEGHALHVVCAWIGNTPKVAAEHYLQVTDEHFAQAVAGSGRVSGGALTKVDSNADLQVSAEAVHAGTSRVVAGVDREEPPLIPQSAVLSAPCRMSEHKFSYPARIRT